MIDVKKLREDLMKTKPTLYCSIMAHLRNKLHMKKVRGNTLFDLFILGKMGNYNDFSIYIHDPKNIIDERRQMYNWTVEDQAKYVKDTIEKYTIEENIAEVA